MIFFDISILECHQWNCINELYPWKKVIDLPFSSLTKLSKTMKFSLNFRHFFSKPIGFKHNSSEHVIIFCADESSL